MPDLDGDDLWGDSGLDNSNVVYDNETTNVSLYVLDKLLSRPMETSRANFTGTHCCLPFLMS